jgi:hypothetical protein
VALSGDGDIALIGASAEHVSRGAIWLFTRSESSWTQQGPRLIGGHQEVGHGEFGYSVALSSDGESALVGSPQETNKRGAVYAYENPEGAAP